MHHAVVVQPLRVGGLGTPCLVFSKSTPVGSLLMLLTLIEKSSANPRYQITSITHRWAGWDMRRPGLCRSWLAPSCCRQDAGTARSSPSADGTPSTRVRVAPLPARRYRTVAVARRRSAGLVPSHKHYSRAERGCYKCRSACILNKPNLKFFQGRNQ